ncbi:hypothetical protein Pyn_15774 [Prunus yedoensis var. nudiflora]|uniref:Transmembrane protein n=1 Tax=Prunus yedoensis var. nudiflora TaxID=2094558 RepID=A0A314YMN0_PRUYE|nr:hypothetical protein Pyn_15774 [Prunus yedoensis var. nudiflora]
MGGKKRWLFFKRMKKESWSLRWKYFGSAFKFRPLNLHLSFYDDVIFKIVSAFEAIVLLLSVCFFYLFCGCNCLAVFSKLLQQGYKLTEKVVGLWVVQPLGFIKSSLKISLKRMKQSWVLGLGLGGYFKCGVGFWVGGIKLIQHSGSVICA